MKAKLTDTTQEVRRIRRYEITVKEMFTALGIPLEGEISLGDIAYSVGDDDGSEIQTITQEVRTTSREPATAARARRQR